MIYQTYQAYEDSTRPLRMFSSAIVAALSKRPGTWGNEILARISATYELLALAGLSHNAPKFGITAIKSKGEQIAVDESVAYSTPFCSLLRFSKPSLGNREDPLDLSAEFYLETVSAIFQKHDLPRGEMSLLGRKVDPRAIRKTALLTIEGEKDDICAVGQTVAAQDLCSSLRPCGKTHHVQTGVGHYGVFSGKRWENEIYPIVRGVIHMSN
jgi:poly-beta-hydroxyalkanoate depolymerase